MTAASQHAVPSAPGTHDPGPRDPSDLSVWAPAAASVELRLRRVDGERILPMAASGDGWFRAPDAAARPGDRYAYRLDGEGPWLPDPRSLSQPDGVHGESEAVDPAALPRDPAWRGKDLRGGVIYELHVGTFTPGPEGKGGTFDSAIDRLGDLAALGIDAVEIMPVAAFPGRRGWGYDGVDLYATHIAYGGPEALARFVTAAHEHGIAVVMDVVYNHLGPDGNYLGLFGPYFTDTHHTPWGSAVNLDAAGADEVRAFILGSARQWLVDFGLDGLRLDAVHELRDDSPRHILAELSDAARAWEQELGRPLTLIAESDLNDPAMVTPTAQGGLGMDMQWADDIHHAVHAWVTGERDGYYVDFGSAAVLGKALTRVFEHDGTFSTFRGQSWGRPVDPDSDAYDAHSFVAFLQDHDQVGNRAAGDRIGRAISPGADAAAASLILCGAPTAMVFQGEEWAASTPFAYFTDHSEELGALVTKGRTEEFAQMGWTDAVPDPQAEQTFLGSILDWGERSVGDHRRILDWYRTLLRLRRTEPELRDGSLRRTSVEVLGEETVILHRGRLGILAHRGAGPLELDRTAEAILARFDGTPASEADPDAKTAGAPADGKVSLSGPGAVVFRSA